MSNETRVNLKHLLEDIRDAYSCPLEEVILVELIANALDSKASRLDLTILSDEPSLRFADNGLGMKRQALREYHNIAASTKTRGQGIGFAGIGAKLSLLLADKVTTESKGGYGSKSATEWQLTGPYRAPWKFVPYSDAIPFPRGTSVTLTFKDADTDLLKPEFLRETIRRHYYPLLHSYLNKEILRFVYKKGIEFVVNGEKLDLSPAEQQSESEFRVFAGKGRRAIGAGFLAKSHLDAGWLARFTGEESRPRHLPSGLSVSTYGKIIKSGWEWLGVSPKNTDALCGLVEIPALSEILTTNKSDFLTDAVHLRKYYRLRRAVQEAVIPLLRSLGEYGQDTARPDAQKNIKPLTKELETALERVADDFPELAPLLSTQNKIGKGVSQKKHQTADSPETETSSLEQNQEKIRENIGDKKDEKEENGKGGKGIGMRKRPGLTLILAELTEEPNALGRVAEEQVLINTRHPAWQKAVATKQEEYHIVLATAIALSSYLDPEKNPQDFIERLLLSWSQVGTQATLL